jgi:Cu(I)/Ag(I) efflux system protein CusF
MKYSAIFPLILALSASSVAFAQSSSTKDMGAKHGSKDSKAAVHEMEATVKKVSPAAGKVTLAHGPVKTLNWPGMTMSFSVHDNALFEKLSVGKKVSVEFVQQGSDYVVTAVK